MRRIENVAQLRGAVGEELGVSDWHEVTQDDIDAFAQVTKDDFWLHVDSERARKGPFGGPIAHGLYTLSLEPMFRYSIVSFEGWDVMVNYGYNRVRFAGPVPVGTGVRMRSMLTDVKDVANGVEVILRQTFEREGAEKPVCIADAVLRFMD
jgi:acyl dehydratase